MKLNTVTTTVPVVYMTQRIPRDDEDSRNVSNFILCEFLRGVLRGVIYLRGHLCVSAHALFTAGVNVYDSPDLLSLSLPPS